MAVRVNIFVILFFLFANNLVLGQVVSPTKQSCCDELEEKIVTKRIVPIESKLNNNTLPRIEELEEADIKIEEQLKNDNSRIIVIDSVLSEINNKLSVYEDSLDVIGGSVINAEKKVKGVEENSGLNTVHLNRFWMLLAAMLVFFMQAGFKVFEVGLVRVEDRNSVGIKNLMDWILVSISFLLVGFAFMFGQSLNGLIGFSLWGLLDMDSAVNADGYKYEFFLFHLAFAATAATIVSGALAVRIKLVSYMILAVLVGAFIYPIFGHWVWGHLFLGGEKPFLAGLGFLDFAGSTVVHSVGAWVAITGMWFIRPRYGKINWEKSGKIIIDNDEKTKFIPHNLGYSVLGVLILWLGWWGFNGGSTPFFVTTSDTKTTLVPEILINTNIAAVGAGLSAFFYSFWFQEQKKLYEKTLGGVLGGLVAITACCNVVSLPIALLVGITAGVLHNIVYDRLNEQTLFGKIIDDPVGAIPVHGACGILGTLCVALGEKNKILSALELSDASSWSVGYQFTVQLFGVLLCAFFTVIVSILVFYVLSLTLGLEVSEEQEKRGENY